MQNYKPKSETKIKVTIKPTPTRFRHKKLQMLKMLLYQVMNQTIYTNLAFRSIRLLRDII